MIDLSKPLQKKLDKYGFVVTKKGRAFYRVVERDTGRLYATARGKDKLKHAIDSACLKKREQKVRSHAD